MGIKDSTLKVTIIYSSKPQAKTIIKLIKNNFLTAKKNALAP